MYLYFPGSQVIVKVLIIILLFLSLKNTFSRDNEDLWGYWGEDGDTSLDKLDIFRQTINQPLKTTPETGDDVDYSHVYCTRRNLTVSVKPKIMLHKFDHISQPSNEIPQIFHQMSKTDTVPKLFEVCIPATPIFLVLCFITTSSQL